MTPETFEQCVACFVNEGFSRDRAESLVKEGYLPSGWRCKKEDYPELFAALMNDTDISEKRE